MIMQVFTAHVRDGAIVPDHDVELSEGSRVTVVAGDRETESPLSADEEEALLLALRQIQHDAVVDAEDLLRRLGE